jgi:hypothetical protein
LLALGGSFHPMTSYFSSMSLGGHRPQQSSMIQLRENFHESTEAEDLSLSNQ